MSLVQPDRVKKVSIGGAVLAALAASSCCIGPLILAALGIGGAGALAALGAYRPYILGVTVVLLAAGFYLTYRRPRAAVALGGPVPADVKAGDACGCEKPDRSAGRAGKVGLWIATAMVVVFAAAPNLIALFESRAHDAAVATAPGATIAHATIHVEGMDCEACATNIRSELAKVGGFHDMTLDLEAKTVSVTYEPVTGRLEAYVAAINDLGYEASLSAQTSANVR